MMGKRLVGGLLALTLAACGGADGSSTSAAGGSGAGERAPSTPAEPATPSQEGSGAGILTAGAWDDNRNYALFRRYADAHASALPLSRSEQDQAQLEFGGDRAPKAAVDAAIVIDTTGSMGDEIAYLRAELSGIAGTVAAAHPGAPQRWAVIAYRDQGDAYVTRVSSFGSLAQTQQSLASLSAGGGGDYPEAPDAALAALQQLSWSPGGDTARVAFWIADAPSHAEKRAALASAVRDARAAGIHVYPVAASGADEDTEAQMRATAQLTGGRYLFITDDSGVGSSHMEPSVPCYFVTKLRSAMERMIVMELTGAYLGPNPGEILRTRGAPQQGLCVLSDGTSASAF